MMNAMKENPLLEKSLLFAARIVKLYQYLSREKKESIISKQILRKNFLAIRDSKGRKIDRIYP